MNQQRAQQTCIIDARVSAEKQLLGTGLENQLEVCQHHARSRNWTTLREYTKSYSGRTEERRDFKEILKDIRKIQRSGTKVHYYLFTSIDRLTRVGSSGFQHMKEQILELGVQPIDVRGVIQTEQNTLEHFGIEYSWSSYSPTDFAQLFEAERAKSEHRDILTRMIGAEIRLTRQGYNIRRTADGYRNVTVVVDGKRLPAIEPDENRSHFYKEMFEMRAAGHHSDEEIVKHINARGFLSVPRNRWRVNGDGERVIVGQTRPNPLNVKQLQRNIKRLLYAGVKLEKWNSGQPVWAIMPDCAKPIVDIKTFNAANRGAIYLDTDKNGNPVILYNTTDGRHIRRRKKFHPDYRYDKLVVCEHCRKPLKNSGKGNRGKLGRYYQAHHCDRTPECREVTGRIPKEKFETALSNLLVSLRFKKGFAEKYEKECLAAYREEEQRILSAAILIGENVIELKREQETLLKRLDVSSSTVVREKTEAEIEALQRRIENATEQRDKIEIEERDIKGFVKWAKELMEHPVKVLGNNQNPHVQRAYFDLVFAQPPTYAEIVSGTPKLQPIFKLSEQFKVDEHLVVNQLRLEWNTLETSIRQWMELNGNLSGHTLFKAR